MRDEDGIERDANGYSYERGVTSQVARQQEILNESWPERDSKGPHARNIREQPAHNHRPCRVRLVFKNDRETILDGLATRWTSSHVYVTVNDQRVRGFAVWVKAEDVRRRD
jgi:hypothetical protein